MADGRRPVVEVLFKAKDLVSGAITGVRSKLAGLVKSVASLGGVVTALATTALVRTVGGWIRAFGAADDAVQSLNAALQATGRFSEEASQQIQQMAKELQAATRHGDEALTQATATVAQLARGLDPAALAESQKAVVGLADAFLQGNLEAAAILVGKAIAGNTAALSRYGITIDKTGTEQDRFNALMQQTQVLFDVSTARAESAGGALEQLGNVTGDVKETLGKLTLEILGGTRTVQDLTDRIHRFNEGLDESDNKVVVWGRLLVQAVKSFVAGIVAIVRLAFNVGQRIGNLFDRFMVGVFEKIGQLANLGIRGINKLLDAANALQLIEIDARIGEIDLTPLERARRANAAYAERIQAGWDDTFNDLGESFTKLGDRASAAFLGIAPDDANTRVLQLTKDVRLLAAEVTKLEKLRAGRALNAEELERAAAAHQRITELLRQQRPREETGVLLQSRRRLEVTVPELAPPDPERLTMIQEELQLLEKLAGFRKLDAGELTRLRDLQAEITRLLHAELETGDKIKALEAARAAEALARSQRMGPVPVAELTVEGIEQEAKRIEELHQLRLVTAGDIARAIALQERLNTLVAGQLDVEDRIRAGRAGQALAALPIELPEPQVREIVPPPVPGAFQGVAPVELPLEGLQQGVPLLDQWASGLAGMTAEGERFGDVLAGITTVFADDFLTAVTESFQAMVEGSQEAGQAFAGSMVRAIAGIARHMSRLAMAEAVRALAQGILGPDPKGFAAAAKYTAAAAAFAALAGGLAGAAGGGGGGGAGSSGAAIAATAPTQPERGEAVIIIEGGFLNMNDPRQAEALSRAIEDLSGRNVRVRGAGR